ncbi:MAG: hypothetical protein ACKN9V_06330 [Pseudomonadota bacterium]
MEKSIGHFFFTLALILSVVAFAEEAPPPTPPVVTEVPSAPTESQLVISPPSPWRGGFLFSGLGALSTVDYEPDYSGGLGWSLGLQIERKITPDLRVLGSFGYQKLSVGRFIASTGSSIFDNYSLYTQTQSGPFVQGLVAVPVSAGHLDFGFEYFHATQATQTTSFGSEYEFKASKFLFVLAGPSMSWKIRGDWELEGHAWFFVNTLGESRFKLMGARLGLALRTPL